MNLLQFFRKRERRLRQRNDSARSFSKKHRADTALDETVSSISWDDLSAPWRVENIIGTGPFREQDWWETEIVSESSTAEVNRRFRNCGQETWLQVRKAWKSDGKAPINSQPSASHAARRELIRGVSRNRRYELRQRVSLKDLVETYNEIWNEDPSDF